MKKMLWSLLLFFPSLLLFAGDSTETKLAEAEMQKFNAYLQKLDSAEKAINYQAGQIQLSNGVAGLNVPKGFKFIPAEQSRFILEDLWENLPDKSVLGMIVKDSFHINSLTTDWAFIVSYDPMGYVKDSDADDINYDDLLKEIKEGQREANMERKKLGYAGMEIIGWASKPYYDKEQKVLHWAKEFKVEGSENNTLNYDVRVLGRKGVLSLNAVANMGQLADVKKYIPEILGMAQFESGHKYSEFDPQIDEVAAWTIGGLVAGKVLAKAGFLAILLKFWKLIAIGLVAFGGTIWKFITGRKNKEEELAVETVSDTNQTPAA